MSADRCNGVQHNVYLQHAYRPDNRTAYGDFQRDLSWASTPANVPRVAQRSTPFGGSGYDPLHPYMHKLNTISYTRHGSPRKFRPSTSSSALLQQQRSTGPSAESPFPSLNVSEQLQSTYSTFNSPMRTSRASMPLSRSASEKSADAFFQGGRLRTAVAGYDQSLREHPNDIWVLTKRCAALCHTGEYERAYADAELLCKLAPSAQARMRLNAIGKYQSSVWNRSNAAVGHETAHITLLQLVTPYAFKQW